MNNKFLLFGIATVIGIFVMHGCSEDYYFDEDFDSLAERRMTRSVTEPATGDEEYITYSYPEVTTIAGDPIVTGQMTEAWDMTIQSCTEESRCEYGFFIYKNHSTGNFYCDPIKAGVMVNNLTIDHGSIALGICSNNLDACAFFHTHTSLQYHMIQGYRRTGPSDADRAAAESYGIPGILYDYATPIIETGDLATADYCTYLITPPVKREDLCFKSN